MMNTEEGTLYDVQNRLRHPEYLDHRTNLRPHAEGVIAPGYMGFGQRQHNSTIFVSCFVGI